jgi:hypothetical protein
MKYYKYLDLNWKPCAEQIIDYISKNPSIISLSEGSWRGIEMPDVLKDMPELVNFASSINCTLRFVALFVSNYKYGNIHIDNDKLSKCRINIPIQNCADTETRFYTTTTAPVKKLQTNGIPFWYINPSTCTQVDQFYLTQAVVFRNTRPHQVVSKHNNIRISCTIAFNEDIEYLLE